MKDTNEKSLLDLNKNLRNELLASMTRIAREKLSDNLKNEPMLSALNELGPYFKDKLVSTGINLPDRSLNYAKVTYLFEDIAKVSNLRKIFLHLEKNSLQDEQIIAIADYIHKMNGIIHFGLNLAHNIFNREDIQIILDSISHFKSLTCLNLDFNSSRLDSKCGVVLADALSNFPNLNILKIDLSSNRLTDDGVWPIFKAIGEIKTLKILSLKFDSNELSSLCLLMITKSLTKLINLTDLTLIVKKIDSQFVTKLEEIADESEYFPNLRKLFINFPSYIIGYHYNLLNRILGNVLNLKELTLQWENSKISNNDSEKLFNAISKLKLTYLSLTFSHCDTIQESIVKFLSKSDNLKNLRCLILDVSYCLKNDHDLESLICGISVLENLEILHLRLVGNKFTSIGVDILINNLPKLKVECFSFKIGNNRLDEKNIKKITKAFGNKVEI